MLIVDSTGEEHVSSEVRGLFSSSQQQNEVKQGCESLLARADRLCKESGKNVRKYKSTAKPYSRPYVLKQFQKNLIIIDYQGNHQAEEIMSLAEYPYDGCMIYNSEMTESEIRDEIVSC